MKNQERLFLAIGGADPELVARSEKSRRTYRLPFGIAAAACLALLVVLGHVLPSWTGPAAAPPDSQMPPSITAPDSPEDQNPDGTFLPEQGSEIGTLRLLSYTAGSQDTAVDFLIYVNEEQFTVQEENGLYSIRSTHPLPEDFPECGMEIAHFSGTSPDQAKSAAENALKENYPEISSEEPAAVLPGSLYLRAGERLEQDAEEPEFWKAKQAEFWFVDDGQGGTFVLTSRYFLEAEEGMGARFRDMASSFRVVNLNEAIPNWMRALYAAVDRLSPALFRNDPTEVSDLLAEGADADAYDENVWPDITIVSVDYTLDNDQDPSKATVSVKHRLNQVEGDSFSFLTMGLIRQNGNWYLDWSGIEK